MQQEKITADHRCFIILLHQVPVCCILETMFIIDLHYTAPLPAIDAAMGEHMKFLNACYKNNLFIASGRKVPRTGGIILAVGSSKIAIEELMAQDPFVAKGLATVTVTEFQASQAIPEFKKLL